MTVYQPFTAEAPAQRRLGGKRFAVYASILNGVGVAAFSGDFACSAIGATVLSFIASACVWLILNYFGKLRAQTFAALCIGFAVAMGVGQIFYFWSQLREGAFRDAFGFDAPVVIRDLNVKRYYVGGPGDSLTLMRFSVSTEKLSELVEKLPASDKDQLIADYRAGRVTIQQFWQGVFGNLPNQASAAWRAPAVLVDLNVRATSSGSAPAGRGIMSKTIVYDRATGEFYIMLTEG